MTEEESMDYYYLNLLAAFLVKQVEFWLIYMYNKQTSPLDDD